MAAIDDWQVAVEVKLAELARDKRTMTYLEMVDYAAIPSPHRIHHLTAFLETLILRDVQLGQPIRAAFIVSKTDGLPADGFFDCLDAQKITPKHNETRKAFYQRLIREFETIRPALPQV